MEVVADTIQPSFSVIVLAAGLGKRMKSNIPKVLHRLGDKPLIRWVLDTVLLLKPRKIIVVVGYKRELVEAEIEDYAVEFVYQPKLLGTADAVKRALPSLPDESEVLVLCGDVPLIRSETVRNLLKIHRETNASATILTTKLSNPKGYGRIVRGKDGDVLTIVEDKDASPEILKINEINSGIYVFDVRKLRLVIDLVNNRNAQGEFYLTDVISLMRRREWRVSAMTTQNHWEVAGVNSAEELAVLEKYVETL